MMTITRIPYAAPIRLEIPVCMWGEIPDVIFPLKFDDDRFKGFWSVMV